MTAKERAERLVNHFEAIQMYRHVLVPFITQAIEDAVEEARITITDNLIIKVNAATAEERETCFKIANTGYGDIGRMIARAITERG